MSSTTPSSGKPSAVSASSTRAETRGVTATGHPWLGEIAPGTDASGRAYTLGRFPDGARPSSIARDFAFQPASPGAPNGGSLPLPANFDFESTPRRAFQTYQAFATTDPTAAGLPPSPDGGKAYRCVDTSGGGVIGVLGDAALGMGSGYRATGWLYVPTATEPAQAVAVGICGRQGSTFFSDGAADRSAYESGYWLIYENRAGVGLADGRADHAGVFELVHATHDNRDAEPVDLLGSLALAATGASAGSWVSFELAIEDFDLFGDAVLVVAVEGVELFRGPLPIDGPHAGAFQVGFRENHAGPPATREGTWVDGLTFVATPLRKEWSTH